MAKSPDDIQDHLRQHVRRAEEIIATNGWTMQWVMPDAVSRTPAYGYTIGLSKTFGHKECFVAGFDKQTTVELLGSMVKAVRDGRSFGTTMRASNVIEDFDVAFRLIADEDSASLGSMLMATGLPTQAVQLIIPDENGLFPWEKGCDQAFRKMQNLASFSDEPPPATQRERLN